MTRTRPVDHGGERKDRSGRQRAAGPEALPNAEDVLRSMHEATKRARDEAAQWLIYRRKMAIAVAEFVAVKAANPGTPLDDGDDLA